MIEFIVMTMKRLSLLCAAIIFSIIGCQPSPSVDYKPKSLLQYGIPVTLLAPDSVTVEKEDWVVQQSISLRNADEKYFVQIWIRDASSYDLPTVKGEKLAEVKAEPGFSKLMQEDPDGFVFERRVDSNTVNYDFRFFQVKGDKEYTSQTDLTTELFSLDEVMAMYNAVRNNQSGS